MPRPLGEARHGEGSRRAIYLAVFPVFARRLGSKLRRNTIGVPRWAAPRQGSGLGITRTQKIGDHQCKSVGQNRRKSVSIGGRPSCLGFARHKPPAPLPLGEGDHSTDWRRGTPKGPRRIRKPRCESADFPCPRWFLPAAPAPRMAQMRSWALFGRARCQKNALPRTPGLRLWPPSRPIPTVLSVRAFQDAGELGTPSPSKLASTS